MLFNIEDYEINCVIAKRISISVEAIILKDSCMIKTLFYDENEKVIVHANVLCNGPAYKKWGYDDHYLVDFVCDYLKIKIKNI
jgi:hypothetical protein